MADATLPKKIDLDYSDGRATSMICASGTGIAKYEVLTLTDPNTAAEVSSTPGYYVCAGIAAIEKSSTDSSTTLTVWKEGNFEVIASGSITVGAACVSYGGGYFGAASAADLIAGKICGYARSTGTDATAFQLRLCVPN